MKLTHVSLAICGGYVPEKFGPVNIKPYILGLYCDIPLVICGFPMFSSAQIVKIVALFMCSTLINTHIKVFYIRHFSMCVRVR